MSKDYSIIGHDLWGPDAQAKVTGLAQYTIDLTIPRMIYGKILRSPHSHAIIKNIDTHRARKIPGVLAIISSSDTPGIKYSSLGVPPSDLIEEDELILNNKARHIGDRIAAVAAVTMEAASEAVRAIEVEYDILPSVFDPEEAFKIGAPLIHLRERNLIRQMKREIGNLDKGFTQADEIFERRYTTQIVQHIPLEPTACLCYFDNNGVLNVQATTHVPHHDRRILAKALKLPISKVRVQKPFLGGSFGCRQQIHQQPVCSLLAAITGTPVKMINERDEDIIATAVRHPVIYYLKVGVKRDGKITAFQSTVYADAGGYSTHTPILIQSPYGKFPYSVPNYRYEGFAIYTNNLVGGAFRGYGNTQFTFARESLFDEIANELNIDPIDFRLSNHVQVGDRNLLGGSKMWSIGSCGIREAVERAGKTFGWHFQRGNHEAILDRVIASHDIDMPFKKGYGVAFAMHGSAAGNNDKASASILMNEDGTVNLLINATDMGQGSNTTLAQVAAQVIGIPFQWVTVYSSDTAFTPLDMGAYASRTAYVVGNAVKGVAEKIKKQLLEHASRILDIPLARLELNDGKFYQEGQAISLTLAQVAWDAYYGEHGHILAAYNSYSAENSPPPFGVQFAEVEVDVETGKIRVVKIVAAYDVGKALNPQIVRGQIYGGIVQGIGYALSEEIIRDHRTGRYLNTGFLSYKVPLAADIPDIQVILVEPIDPTGPFGAKSIGEACILATAPAISNAVFQAIGIRIHDLPITPAKVLRAIKDRKRLSCSE